MIELVIADEIHGAVSMIDSGFIGPLLYRLLMTAEELNLYFINTPLINYSYEAGILCNILKVILKHL